MNGSEKFGLTLMIWGAAFMTSDQTGIFGLILFGVGTFVFQLSGDSKPPTGYPNE